MFKTPFPACNVPRRNEDVATDMVYSDTPTFCGGETYAQIFVGCKTFLTDIYGLKSQKQFVNALQDQIRERELWVNSLVTKLKLKFQLDFKRF